MGDTIGNLNGNTGVNKYITPAGVYHADGYGSDTRDVLLVSDAMDGSYNANCQYLFSNAGAQYRYYGFYGGGEPWKKLGVRGATVVVGASGADYGEPDVDYLCTGTEDGNTIKSAINSLPADGGTVLLLEGTYRIGAPVSVGKANVTLMGCGPGTRLLRAATSNSSFGSMLQITGADCTVKNLYINPAHATSNDSTAIRSTAARTTIEAVEVTGCCAHSAVFDPEDIACVSIEGVNSKILGCYIHANSSDAKLYGIRSKAAGALISGNVCSDNQGVGDTYGIYTETRSGARISGNSIDANHSSGASGYGLYVGGPEATVTGNYLSFVSTARPTWSLYLASSKNTVSGNSIDWCSCNAQATGLEIAGDSNSVCTNTITGGGDSTYAGLGLRISGKKNTVSGNQCCYEFTATQSIVLTAASQNNVVTGNVVPVAVTDQNTTASAPNILAYNSDATAGGGLPQLTFASREAVTASGSALDNMLDGGVYDIVIHSETSSYKKDLHALLIVSYDGYIDLSAPGADHYTRQTIYWDDGTIQHRIYFYTLWLDWATYSGPNIIQSGAGTDSIILGNNNAPYGFNYLSPGYNSIQHGANANAKGTDAKSLGPFTTANDGQLVTGQYNAQKPGINDTTANASIFIVGNGYDLGTEVYSNAFRVAKSGSCYGTGAFNTTGADYAEFFEWADGNVEGADRRGRFVTLDGDKIRFATAADDYILGAISSKPGVVGDSYCDGWQGKYQTDVFGKVLTEYKSIPEHTETKHIDAVRDEEGNTIREARDVEIIVPAFEGMVPLLNPDYDPDAEYIPREMRDEWGCVGMMGKLVVCDDGTCAAGGYCSVANGGVATASQTGWRVMKRIDSNHVIILFR